MNSAGGAVITPHPGEMARLIGQEIDFVRANRVDIARDFAANHNV
jgi:NAD(P)H-hydrate epimerase